MIGRFCVEFLVVEVLRKVRGKYRDKRYNIQGGDILVNTEVRIDINYLTSSNIEQNTRSLIRGTLVLETQ